MTVVPYFPEKPVTHKLSWPTDVIAMRDGTEQRISLDDYPREEVDFQLVLDTTQMSILKEILFANPNGPHTLPIFHQGVLITTTVSGTTIIVDNTENDFIVVDAPVLVRNQRGQYYVTAVATVSGQTNPATITVDDAVPGGETYGAGLSHIYPIRTGYFEDQAPLGRYSVALGQWQFKFLQSTIATEFGRGATIIEFDDLPVFTRPPSSDSLVQEQLAATSETLDYGGAFAVVTNTTIPNIAKMYEYVLTTEVSRQYMRRFVSETRGRQKPYLAPTWAEDLVPSGAAPSAGATALLVECPPTEGAVDYIATYWPYPSYRRIQILYATGAIDYRVVQNAVDNADGTATLTVQALTGGTIDLISFLEYTRLATDDLIITYDDKVTTKLGMTAIQEPFAQWCPTADQSFEDRTGITPDAVWDFSEASGNIIDLVGSLDLVAAGTRTYRDQPEERGRYGVKCSATGSLTTTFSFGTDDALIGVVVDFENTANQEKFFGGGSGVTGYAMLYKDGATSVAWRLLAASGANVLHLTLGIPTVDTVPYLLMGRINRNGATADGICCRLGSTVLSNSGSIAGFATFDSGTFGTVAITQTRLYYAFKASGAQVRTIPLTNIARSLGFHV